MTNLSQIVKQQQDRILEIYLEETPESQRKLLSQTISNENVAEYFDIELEKQIIIADHLARISDIQFRLRNVIHSKFAQYISKNNAFDAYSFKFTLEKVTKPLISKEAFQNILDHNIVSHSVTAHPTNPYSSEYTIKSMQLDGALSSNNKENIRNVIGQLIKINPVPLISNRNEGKKSQKEEIYEALSYIKNLYHNLPIARRKMQQEIDEFGLDVKIGKFYEICVWLAGDGDGNFNATAKSLQSNINIFKEEILKLYQNDLNEVLKIEDYSNPLDLIADLKKIPKNDKIEDVIYQIENFGFHFAKIDIRHSSADIQITADELRNNPNNLKNQTAIRIWDRLQIVAKNPEFFDKLIISECKSSKDVLNAMFLLKTSNCKALNIITLSESADDLINLEENIADLLENETYRNHIIAKGKLYYMIAKSDTQRRDGVGAHFAQEFAVEKVTNIVARRATKYPSLQNVKLIPFNGAGHALQRGGGRIDEIPNIYAKAAMRGLYWLKNKHDFNILPPALTTQGHQNGILFSYANCVNFLTSYFSQSLYAKFKMRGLIADSEIPNVEARKYRESFFNAARKNYWEEVSTLSSPINLLFTQGPWASVELSNVSSRPSKRVENYALQLIDQRAIGTEKMCAHSGTHLISWYSARAGLEEIGLKAGRFMYLNDKATRDSFRNIAMSLFMCDFEISWKMMIGKNHPKLEEIENLAAKYKNEEFCDLNQNNQNQITLAHLEIEAIKTAALIHKIIVNEDLICSLTPQNLLNELWPNLANRIKNREKKLKFTHLIEAKLTFNLPENEKRYPNNSQLKQLFRAINAACTGSEAPNITLIRSINRDFVSEFENDLNSDLVEKLSIV